MYSNIRSRSLASCFSILAYEFRPRPNLSRRCLCLALVSLCLIAPSERFRLSESDAKRASVLEVRICSLFRSADPEPIVLESHSYGCYSRGRLDGRCWIRRRTGSMMSGKESRTHLNLAGRLVVGLVYALPPRLSSLPRLPTLRFPPHFLVLRPVSPLLNERTIRGRHHFARP
jgi:hypothetical protein